MTAKNLGTGGSSLNAQFGDGTTSSTFPIHLEHVETDYLYLPGNSRNFAALAPSPSLEFVGDIDVSVRVALDNWTAADQTLIGRGYGNGYWFYTTATNINFSIALASGGNIYPGVAWSSRPANGSSIWLRATRVASTGVVTFYSGVDGPNEPSWTLIGTITSTSGNMGYPGSHPVGIGAATQAGGSFAHATGKFYRVIIRNGINGTKVADVDFTTGLESGGQYSIINTSSDKRGIYASTVENLGTGGAQLDAISGSAVDTTTNDPLWLGIEESKFVRTPGVAGNYVAVPHSPSLNILGTEGTPFLSLPGFAISSQYASSPDTAALDITGDIDLRCRAQLTPVVPVSGNANLITKGGLGGNYSFFFGVNTAGRLFFEWSNNGVTTTFKTSTVAATVPAGVPYWYRATMDADNGAGGNDIAFYVSPDGITWTQVGTTVTTAGVAVINNSASALQLGGYGGSSFTDGRIYRAQVLNGINGTVVFDADFTQQALGSRGFIESTGKLVSLVGNAAQIVDGTTYGFSAGVAGSRWTAPDSVALSITGDIDMRMRLSLNDWTPSAETGLFSKWAAAGDQRSYMLRLSTTGTFYISTSPDGTAPNIVTISANAVNTLTNGQTYWIRATLDVDDGAGGKAANFYYAPDSETEPTVWTSIGTTVTAAGTTSISDSTSELEVGSASGGAGPVAGRVYRAIIRGNLTSGTKAFDADFTRQLQFASTFTEGSANLATVTTVGAARIERDRDLDLRVKVALDDWTPSATSALVSKALTPLLTDTNRSYYLSVNTTGTLVLAWSTTGVPATQTPATSVAPALADGSVKWVRVTLDVNNGANGHTVSFYTSDDGSSWTVLGSPIVATGATSIFPGLAPVEVGSLNAGGTQPLAGKFFNAEIRNGIDGPAVLDLDFSNSITIKNQKYIPGDSFSTISEAEQFLPNLGTGGTALNARYGSSVAAETSDPLLLTHTGTNYLYLPGRAVGDLATTADAAPLRVTGDLDVRVWVAADNWRPAGNTTMFSKGRESGAPNYGWWLWIAGGGNGLLSLFWSADGTNLLSATSTVGVPFANGEASWVRATLDVDNGAGGRTVTFYISNDGVTWSQLGAEVIQAGTTSIHPSTEDINLGYYTAGKFYRAQILSGINGAAVWDANFTTGITSGAQTSFTATVGGTVTIGRSTSGRKSVAVVQDVLLFGTDDYLEVPDNDLLDFGATDSFTVMAAVRSWNNQGFNDSLIAKKNASAAAGVGWNLQNDGGSPNEINFRISDGTFQPIGFTSGRSMGVLIPICGVRNVSSDNVVPYLGATAGTSASDTTTGSLSNGEVMRIGRLSGAGTEYGDFEWRGSAIWRRALTVAEVALVNTHYTTGPTTESTKLLQEAVWWVDSSIRNVAQINQTNILNPAQAKIDGAYVYTPGSAGNYVAVPHSPSLNILGTEGTPFLSLPVAASNTAQLSAAATSGFNSATQLDLRAAIRAESYQLSNQLAFTRASAATSASRQFAIFLSSGLLGVLLSDGTTTSVPNVGGLSPSLVPDGGLIAVRATWRSSDGRVQFFTKATSPATAATDIALNTGWTQLGTNQVGPTVALNATSFPLNMNGYAGGSQDFIGDMYAAQGSATIDGAPLVQIDFTQQALGSRGFIESTGKLVSLVGNAAQIVDGTTYGFMPSGTGSGWTVPEDNDLDLNSFEIIARLSLNDWATTAINQAIVSKYTNTQIGGVAQRTYIFRVNGRDLLLDYVLASDPSTVKLAYTQTDFLDSTNFANGKIGWIRVTRNKDTGVIQFFKAADSETIPTSWTQGTTLGDQLTGDLYNSNVVTTLGAFNEGLGGYNAAGRFYRAIINNNSSGGTKVLDADFTRQIQFASTFTEGSSQLATVTTGSISRIERDRDLEIVTRFAADSWNPSTNQLIINKIVQPGTANQISYLLRLIPGPYLELAWSINGSAVTQVYTDGPPPALTGLVDGQTYWIKATLDVNNGSNGRTVRFYTAPDSPTEPTVWTQVGAASVATGATSIFPSVSRVEVGSASADTSSFYTAGKMYRAIIRNGIDGPAILDIDFSDTLNTGGESYIQDTQLEAIPEAEQFLPNLGWGGTALNARYGASVAAEPNTHDPLLLTHTGTNYLYLPGGAVNNLATIPDSPALDVVGDVDFRFDVALDTYRPTVTQALFLRLAGDPNQYVYTDITEAGVLRFSWYPLGTNASVKSAISTVPVPFLGGERTWIRIVLDVDNGAGGHDVIFYISQDGTNWSQLGNVVTGAGTTNLASVTAEMRVWSNTSSGKIYRCQMLNGINGPAVYDVNFTTGITSGSQTTFTESSSNAATVTINRSTSGRKSVAVVQDVLLFGTDDYLEVPDNDLLDFGATDSFTVMTAVRQWATPLTFGRYLAKQTAGAATGYRLTSSDTAFAGRTWIADGTNADEVTSPVFASGQVNTLVSVVNRSSNSLTPYSNGTAGTADTSLATGSLANGEVLRIGRASGATLSYQDFEFRGSAIWRRALSAAEVALVNTHYTTGPTAASLALMQEAVWWIDAGIRSVAQINRSLSGRKTTAVSTDVMLFGTNNYLEVADNDLLDFGRNDSFTIITAVRQWATPASNGSYVTKRSTGAGWLLQSFGPALQGYVAITDGVNLQDRASAAFVSGASSVLGLLVDRSAQTISSIVNASTGPTASIAAVGSLANGIALMVGRNPSGNFQDFEFRGSAIWRRALTSQEIALINTHYTTGPTTASNALLQEAVWWIDAKQSRSGAGISRSTSGLKSVTVTRPTWLVGNGRYFEVSDNNLLDANATQSFSIFAVVRQWPTPTNYGMYVNKVDSSIGDKGYLLGGHETNNVLYASIDDQPTQATRFDQSTKPGKLQMVCMVVDRSVQTLRTYVDGVAGTVANIVSVGSLETGVPLRIGRTASGGTALHADVEIVSVGLFRRALTDKEVIDISAYYGTSNPINEATVLTGEDGNYLLLENGEPIIIE